MLQIFQRWLRITGFATLLLTGYLATLWWNSVGTGDVIVLPSSAGQTSTNTIISIDSRLIWRRVYGLVPLGSNTPMVWTVYCRSGEVTRQGIIPDPFFGQVEQWRFGEFAFSHRKFAEDSGASLYHIPYWSIVIPLAIVSVCLLLGSYRKPKACGTDTPA